MKGIKIPKIYFLTILILFFMSIPVFTLTQFSPKIWLSEYGYIEETSEDFDQVSFPVSHTENRFSNSFLSKTDTEVVVHENTSFIVFTCEAEYPISWFATQELKTSPDVLKTRTFEFQSIINVSQEKQTFFKSLIIIYREKYQYYSETDEYLLVVNPGKWKFSCQKANVDESHYEKASISVILEESNTTEIYNLSHIKLEEKIVIAMLTKHNAFKKFTGFSLGDVYHHYPNFYANENQQITLAKNYSTIVDDHEDTFMENSKLVDFNHDEEIMKGDKVQILCYSSRKLYSHGAVVKLVWENGTEIMLPEKIYDFNDEPEIRLSDDSKNFGRKLFVADDTSVEEDMLYYISEEITVEIGMTQVDCYMPVWVDGKWDKVSRSINVAQKYL